MLSVQGMWEPGPEGLMGKSGGEQRGGDARETRLGSRGPAVEGRASRGQSVGASIPVNSVAYSVSPGPPGLEGILLRHISSVLTFRLLC